MRTTTGTVRADRSRSRQITAVGATAIGLTTVADSADPARPTVIVGATGESATRPTPRARAIRTIGVHFPPGRRPVGKTTASANNRRKTAFTVAPPDRTATTAREKGTARPAQRS